MARTSLRAASGPEEEAAQIGAAARRGAEERLGATGLTEATATPGESRTKSISREVFFSYASVVYLFFF